MRLLDDLIADASRERQLRAVRANTGRTPLDQGAAV